MLQLLRDIFDWLLGRRAGVADTAVLVHHSDGSQNRDFIACHSIRRFEYHWHPERQHVEIFCTCDSQRTWWLAEFPAASEPEAVDIFERVIKDCGFKSLVINPGQ